MDVEVINEPAPAPRAGGWGRGKLECNVRLMTEDGECVGENHSVRSGVNELLPNELLQRKY